jgi:hypothetical protein
MMCDLQCKPTVRNFGFDFDVRDIGLFRVFVYCCDGFLMYARRMCMCVHGCVFDLLVCNAYVGVRVC